MPKLKNHLLLASGGLVLIVAVISLVFFWQKKAFPKPPSLPSTFSPTPEHFVIPTKTPQEIEIISKIETHTVEIENDKFNPPQLQIKLHDQVVWVNKNNKTHKITGEGWGNVPIENGESFTQAFDEPGTYSYSCALHPEMRGSVTVGQ